jgi:hypothetical protein
MASKKFEITSPEGAERYGAELGDQVELELEPDTERAVVAAGWLEPVTATTTKKKEG